MKHDYEHAHQDQFEVILNINPVILLSGGWEGSRTSLSRTVAVQRCEMFASDASN